MVVALAVCLLIGMTISAARADGDSDTHRIALALDKQTAALEKIARSLERIADRREGTGETGLTGVSPGTSCT